MIVKEVDCRSPKYAYHQNEFRNNPMQQLKMSL
jgi:hypothetical protein